MEVEDLIQVGMVALVEAANGFEDRGHAFSTYATIRIRGAMIDHLRRHATICRSTMARRRELTVVRARLVMRLGRGASDDARQSLVSGKSVSVRVHLVCRHNLNKNNNNRHQTTKPQ